MAFRGWPAEAITFYAELEADNTKAFWEARRSTYDEAVKAPFAELSEVIAEEFGELHLFRPHRDVRFSKDKSPYKTAAGAVAEGEGGTRFYVQIGSDGLYVGCGYYHPAPDQLERWRAAVADDRSGPALAEAVAEVRGRGLEVGARETLVRAPRGYPKDHPRIDLLRLKGCHAGRSFPPRRWLSTAGALDRVVGTWREAEPLTRMLDLHVGPSHLPPDEAP
ncbi:MAG TPA: DUF2461 domain-containing protein [Iamia sp.]